MHRRMLVIRGFEQRVAALYRDGEIPGFVHLSIGQEATAVGACWPLGPTDVITSTHRGHGHCLAKGLDAPGMFAELMAKDQGTNRGRGGSMHIADPDDRHLRRERDRGRGAPDRGGRGDRLAAARRRLGGGGVLRRRRGRAGRVPRSGEPGRGVEAPGRLLLREQRVRRVLPGVDAARGDARAARRGIRRRLRRGRRQRRRRDRIGDARRGRGHPRRRRARHRRGRDPPLARPLRGRPAALPDFGRDGGGGGGRPAPRPRERPAVGRHR